MIAKPTQRLHPKAKKAWQIRGLVGLLFYTLLVGAYFVSRIWLTFLPWWPGLMAGGFFLFVSMISIFVFPAVRMHYWGYDIREEDIDIQSGMIVIKRVLIPMNRVQHVDLEYGPIMRHFNLASLVITTAGSNHKIPAIAQDVALELRKDIARLVYENEDDV